MKLKKQLSVIGVGAVCDQEDASRETLGPMMAGLTEEK